MIYEFKILKYQLKNEIYKEKIKIYKAKIKHFQKLLFLQYEDRMIKSKGNLNERLFSLNKIRSKLGINKIKTKELI